MKEGPVFTVHEDLTQSGTDEATTCDVVRSLGLLPVPDEGISFWSPSIGL